ncbi:MAG: helix-turn-helix transcriptional regulator [Butyrivibrio sp.]|uniref:helix-turn-helix transcriptional regulator n=1 Tax=Butyrivibrio sp. TaxID=28121 RepID=UPI001B2F02EE|nr:helix-turn-helix transcriptional regulator [Butyrivibrio sp.]MBO6242678.1 helix-turn-helix transcriptional regulator [Butyrivibrio sp.]
MNKMLGSRIKALRIANNFTQEQVSDRIGVSRQKYARIESGNNSITLDILSKIAGVLNVTVGDITRVLDETPDVAFRIGADEGASSEKIFDMLDLFYANKHMYNRLRQREMD